MQILRDTKDLSLSQSQSGDYYNLKPLIVYRNKNNIFSLIKDMSCLLLFLNNPDPRHNKNNQHKTELNNSILEF